MVFYFGSGDIDITPPSHGFHYEKVRSQIYVFPKAKINVTARNGFSHRSSTYIQTIIFHVPLTAEREHTHMHALYVCTQNSKQKSIFRLFILNEKRFHFVYLKGDRQKPSNFYVTLHNNVCLNGITFLFVDNVVVYCANA